MVFALFLGGLLALSLLVNVASLPAIFGGGSPATGAGGRIPLQEVTFRDNDSRNKIAVVEVLGVISGYDFDGTGRTMVDYIKDQLRRAAEDDRVKAVILKVDSPGGEVLASDNIYKAVAEFQKEHGKPVIGSMGGMAASGGYYVSAPCQWIVANELTMTGSIGVIMQGFNFRGLMDKVGVKPLTFKSGRFKDMLSFSKPPEEISEEERKIVQNFIDETFGRFKLVIRDGRAFAKSKNGGEGRELAENWEELADGRLLSGTQAFEHGFVDELGDFDTAVKRALGLANVSDANLVKYQRTFDLGNLFRLLGDSPGEETTIRVDWGVELPRLEAGRPYFLPSHIFDAK